MALPIYVKCTWRQPRRLKDQHFGLGLTPNDFLSMKPGPKNYYRQWRNLPAMQQDAGFSIKEDTDKFQVYVDVQHFAPEEISVKTADGFVVVEAKHEEKKDEHGFITRSFARRYTLPEGVVEDKVTTRLSSDGVLSIIAPLKQTQSSNERIVPIIQTGAVKKRIKQN